MLRQKNNSPSEDSFEEAVKKACDGLFYTSETDAKILPFFGGKIFGGARETILKRLDLEKGSFIEERSFVEFFSRLTKIHEWFKQTEIRKAERFLKLEKLLEENLDDLTVLRIGRIQIDIYAVGIDKEGNLAGIRTKAVET